MKRKLLGLFDVIRIHKEYLSFILGVIWFISSIIIGYNIVGIYQNSDMPSEEKYHAYETIIQKIADGNVRDITIPDNTKISVYQNSIIVENDFSHYAVSGNLTEEKVSFLRKDGNGMRIVEKIFFGSFVIGVIVGNIVLSYVIKFLFFILSSNCSYLIACKKKYIRRNKSDLR